MPIKDWGFQGLAVLNVVVATMETALFFFVFLPFIGVPDRLEDAGIVLGFIVFGVFAFLNLAVVWAIEASIDRWKYLLGFDPLERANRNPPPPPPRPQAWDDYTRPPPVERPDFQWTSPPPRYESPPPVNSKAWAYQELGVATSASPQEVKAAYRRLVLQYHPDRNPNPKAVERFRRVQAAYDALSG